MTTDRPRGLITRQEIQDLALLGGDYSLYYTGDYQYSLEELFEEIEDLPLDNIQLELFATINYPALILTFYWLWGDPIDYLGSPTDFLSLDFFFLENFRDSQQDSWQLIEYICGVEVNDPTSDSDFEEEEEEELPSSNPTLLPSIQYVQFPVAIPDLIDEE